MNEEFTYNLCCLNGNGCSSKTVQKKGLESDVFLCDKCNKPLKMMGIASSILLVNKDCKDGKR